MTENGIIVFGAIAALVLLWYFWVRLPAKMARNRGRSALGWVLLTWILTPFWSIIILLIAGDSDEKIADDVIDRLKK
jgi:hypothetical protein